MQKKVLLQVIIVVLIIIAMWFFLSMGNNSTTDPKEIPIISDLQDANATCQTTQTGWKCSFEVKQEETTSVRTMKENELLTSYKNACQAAGGAWKCYGMCMPFYEHYCDFKYADAGELCISDLQCGSACIGTFGVGTCANYPLRMCDWYSDLLFIVPNITRGQVLCD